MSTKLITIKDRREWREGDHFTGNLHIEGVDLEVTGALKVSSMNRTVLYVLPQLPDVFGSPGAQHWKSATVVREVEEPKPFGLGTIVRDAFGVRIKTDIGWAWIDTHESVGNSTLRHYTDDAYVHELIERQLATIVYDPSEEVVVR
jgi:hypothetical protein